MLSRLRTGAAVLVAAAMGGWIWIHGLGLVAARTSAVDSKLSQLSLEVEALRRENSDLRNRLKGMMEQEASHVIQRDSAHVAAGADPNPLTQLKTIADLQKRSLVSAPTAPVDFEGRLDARFKELFQLTDGEQVRLQRAVDRTRAEVEAGELSHASLRKNGDGSLVIEMQPLERAPAIYDELVDEFKETLGEERFAAFLTLSEPSIGGTLNNFGGETRSLTMSRLPEIDPHFGQLYQIEEARKGPWSFNGSNRLNREMMIRRFGRIMQLLPADF